MKCDPPTVHTGTLAAHVGKERAAAMAPRLAEFARLVAEEIEPRVDELERRRDLPAVRSRDELGRRVERVVFDELYHQVGRLVWSSGILALQAEPGRIFEQAALGYLLAHAGEGGHTCPVACTAGLIRALQQHGDEDLRRRFLPALLRPNYDEAERGAQFLTEVQGGADVGANRTRAEPDPEGKNTYRLHGEKWFCSVADAQQMVVTARPAGAPEGTAGLGCFLVPRHLEDGTLNGFHLHRLKPKIGTRCLATGEITFEGARAWAIGPLKEGFHIAVGVVLNTSRWFNALGSAALMRRAYLEARRYARERIAFGRPIAAFPAVRRHLAIMHTEELAALASTLELTGLVERLDTGTADEREVAFHRFLVNANKFVTARAATEVVHRGIEIFGGNGTIEDYSPLPRLYRDAIVYETWEGPHDVLCAQVRRDLARPGMLEQVAGYLRARLTALPDGPWKSLAGVVAETLDHLEPRVQRSLEDETFGSLHFRTQLRELMRVVQATVMLHETAAIHDDEPELARRRTAAIAFFVRHGQAGYDPETDPDALAGIDTLLGYSPEASRSPV